MRLIQLGISFCMLLSALLAVATAQRAFAALAVLFAVLAGIVYLVGVWRLR